MKGDHMRKKFLGLLTLLLATSLVACGAKEGEDKKSEPAGDSETSQVTPAKRYTVKFMNGEERVATESVKEGETLSAAQIPAVQAPEGKTFAGWSLTEGGEIVDLSTYLVTEDVTFYAIFKNADVDDSLDVNAKKEDGKTYYLVMGWWECTKIEDGAQKLTSYLTETDVRIFYTNVINYLKASGATAEDIANIQFRNYSSVDVAALVSAVNTDADVGLLIGVGKNINSTGNVTLLNGNDSKFQVKMGSHQEARYIANPAFTNEVGTQVFDWLNNLTQGDTNIALSRIMTADEIAESAKPVDLAFTVNVHGDELKTTVLHTKTDTVEMPTITIPDGKNFKGFALSETGEVVLEKAIDATLKYEDLVSLVAEGVKTIDLYPVFEDKPVVLDDLVIYIQTGSRLSEPEAKLVVARFKETLTDKQVRFETNNGDSDGFTTFINGKGDADVIIGGNDPLKYFTLKDGSNLPLSNAGVKHFANTSRKVIIPATVADSHLELATSFYNFVKAEAPVYEFHYTYWHNSNKWVKEAERTAISEAIAAHINTYLGIEASETLLEKYNVKLTEYVAEGTKVAALGEETRALREGKGTDLIIGCGGNVADTDGAGMTVVEFKDIPTTIVAAGRKVALVNENPLAREIYDNYFVEPSTPEQGA